MSNGNGKLALYLKIAAAVLVPLAAVLIAWGSLNQRVATNERILERKADAMLVDVQYQAILRELEQINDRLEQISR